MILWAMIKGLVRGALFFPVGLTKGGLVPLTAGA